VAAIITIRPEREKPVLNQHPWVFSGAVASMEGDPQPGEIVTLVGKNNRFLGRGYYNPRSQIVVRILTWQDEPIDDDWWRRMLARAIKARWQTGSETNARRLVNAENDFLPGLIVDQYDNWLVLQALTLGIDQRKAMIADLLQEVLQPDGIYERSDVDVRGKEGLKESNAVLRGEQPPGLITIREHDQLFSVDLQRGHKTGFYLDQRENRRLVGQLTSDLIATNTVRLPRVLNLFSYSGGFGIYAEAGGATQVINVDASREALELAEENFRLNGLLNSQIEFVQGNVFDYLRDVRESGEQYDIVVLDPPKFAQNAKQIDNAARGYKDLNLNALHCMKPGGYLMTFSCSGAISADLFQKIVFGALADSGRQGQILRHLGPGDDHPVALTFPEGAYLKGLLLRVF
jgi:23S rRNA (cytosine1962-C5)-methyltransferase